MKADLIKLLRFMCAVLRILLMAFIWPNALAEWLIYFPHGPAITVWMLLLLVVAVLRFCLEVYAQERRFTKMEIIWLVVTLAAVVHPLLARLIPESLLGHLHSGADYPIFCETCILRISPMYVIPWSIVTLLMLLSQKDRPRGISRTWDILCFALVPVAVAGVALWLLCTESDDFSLYSALNSGSGGVFLVWTAVRPLLWLFDHIRRKIWGKRKT